MTEFDRFDALLDTAQNQHFGESMIIKGKPVIAIADTLITYLSEVPSTLNVWSVSNPQLSGRLSRGDSVIYQQQNYVIGKTHPDDGNNQIFQLEKV